MSEAVIAGLNKQLTEQFELSTKYIAIATRRADALRAVIHAYGSQDGGHSGVMDKAIALARTALTDLT